MCGREQLVSRDNLSAMTICDLEEVASESNINISSLMSEAYCAIGDPDGIYGCGTDQRGGNIGRLVTAVNDCLVIRL